MSAVLAGAVAIALVTGPAGDRPGLERGGAVTTAPQLARAGAAATAKSAVRTGHRAQQGRVLTTVQRPAASSSLEHSSRGNRARSTPASRSPLLLAADDLPPLTGRIKTPQQGLRAGPLVLFGSEDPTITIAVLGNGSVTLTDQTAGGPSCSATSNSSTPCSVASDTDTIQLVASPGGSPGALSWSGGTCGQADTLSETSGNPDDTCTFSPTGGDESD
ncbi:MAG: hypothetical protein ABSB73_12040, partial [Solirubrobacteraceae bacterium]